MNSDANWAQLAQQFQDSLSQGMQKAMDSVPSVLMQGVPAVKDPFAGLQ